MINVKLTGGNREDFTGILGNIKWIDGKATVPNLTQRLASCYGVVEDKASVEDKPPVKNKAAEPEDKVNILETPIKPDEVFSKVEQDNGASELAKVIASKKAEIEAKPTLEEEVQKGVQFKTAPEGMKKSDVKSFDDFKGKGSWGTYKKYVIDLTGTSPRNKQQCAEALELFKATLSD